MPDKPLSRDAKVAEKFVYFSLLLIRLRHAHGVTMPGQGRQQRKTIMPPGKVLLLKHIAEH
jgi:hypothetical protein